MNLTFIQQMQALLDAVLAAPKGSFERRRAEREWAQFIRQHHQPRRHDSRLDYKQRAMHDPDVEDYDVYESER